eukprot:1181368-Prorocentrum_minimum.AAC.1
MISESVIYQEEHTSEEDVLRASVARHRSFRADQSSGSIMLGFEVEGGSEDGSEGFRFSPSSPQKATMGKSRSIQHLLADAVSGEAASLIVCARAASFHGSPTKGVTKEQQQQVRLRPLIW